MLSISRFSEDKEGILKGLKKRKFDNFEIIDKIGPTIFKSQLTNSKKNILC